MSDLRRERCVLADGPEAFGEVLNGGLYSLAIVDYSYLYVVVRFFSNSFSLCRSLNLE